MALSTQKYDFLIVGAGLFGCMFAHMATQRGKKCLVIDKRPHLGGNLYCEQREGIHVHRYGAHIFHTNSKRVWDFVNSLVEFNRFTNSPVVNYHGKLYNLPFNMNTFYQMWGVTTPAEAEAKLEEQRQEAVQRMRADGVEEPRNLEEQALSLVGADLYERLIKGYTEKQWGRKCAELPAFIIKRLPVRLVFDNNYFNDCYQGIPKGGYNALTDRMLDGVDTLTNLDFLAPFNPISWCASSGNEHAQGAKESTVEQKKCSHEQTQEQLVRARVLHLLKDGGCNFPLQGSLKDAWQSVAHRLVYTGQIDEFFDNRLGKLAYRTVRFEDETLDEPNYQGNAVVNYTAADVPYTRIIEHKHFDMFGNEVYRCPKTVISKEYSTEWKPGMEPYYPVNDEHNNNLYQKYKALADEYNAKLCTANDSLQQENVCKDQPPVIFGGRLAEYKYYDMAPIVDKVLSMFD
ncbi:MAG: UDP-galactopyranose mutase [Prevotella sp.]|nr:UDP-galactopyranose mutase [Prevotella sp.]